MPKIKKAPAKMPDSSNLAGAVYVGVLQLFNLTD